MRAVLPLQCQKGKHYLRLSRQLSPAPFTSSCSASFFSTHIVEDKKKATEGVDSSSNSQSVQPLLGGPNGQSQTLVKYEDIARANYRIKEGIVRTELKKSYWLSKLCECEIFLKMELAQFTGSFKERGARNSLLLMDQKQREKGVIAASAGNHALAMAWHGKSLGVGVTVLMPTVAPLAKVEKCRSFGANVVIHGANIGEAKSHAETAPEFEGMRYVNGYDDIEIISGAGTMGVEILEQLPETDVIVIPTGGAGLLAGTSLAMKTLKPSVEVFGVETNACASFTAALEAGNPVPVHTTATLADGLAVPCVGSNAFEVARENTDEIVKVDESDVALAMLRLVETEKLVVEGGGATGLAGILPGGPLHERVRGKKVVVPLCGGNIDTTTLGRVIERGLAADERLVRFVAEVSDLPGGIADLTRLLSDHGASIKDIFVSPILKFDKSSTRIHIEFDRCVLQTA